MPAIEDSRENGFEDQPYEARPVLPHLNTETWYRLSNSRPGHALDVVNLSDSQTGKLDLRPEGNYSGQHWRLRHLVKSHEYPDGEGDDLWALETWYLGPEKRLDVFGNNPRSAHLADRGSYSGQRWWILLWPGSSDEYKLSNTYSGLYLALDTSESGNVVLSRSDATCETQRWRFVPIRPIALSEREGESSALQEVQ